jgi:CheY-like chemotaxis protein
MSQTKYLLYAEDDVHLRTAMVRLLTDTIPNLEITEASNEIEAVKCLQSADDSGLKFDLVLTDQRMSTGKFDGNWLVELIKQRKLDLPVFLLSGDLSKASPLFDKTFSKGGSLEYLKESIREQLKCTN